MSEALRLLDGGTGSELRKRGVALSAVCWSGAASLGHDDVLRAIHRDYIEAGADIVTANTFGVTRFVLAAAGLAEQQAEVVRRAVAAARAAAADCGRPITVAASISCLPPAFDRTVYPAPDDEYRAYAELAALLADNGIELVLLEMLQDSVHAALACRAAAASGLDWWAGVSCRLDPRPRKPAAAGRLVAFDDRAVAFESVLETVLGFGPGLVAIMHSPLDAMNPALERVGSLWSGAIGAWAELPYPEDPDAVAANAAAAVTPDPTTYAEAARGWRARGASVLGGCCGTTPAHIAALSAALGAGRGRQ